MHEPVSNAAITAVAVLGSGTAQRAGLRVEGQIDQGVIIEVDTAVQIEITIDPAVQSRC